MRIVPNPMNPTNTTNPTPPSYRELLRDAANSRGADKLVQSLKPDALSDEAWQAICAKALKQVKEIIGKGFNIDAPLPHHRDQHNMLQVACEEGWSEGVRALLSLGANPHARLQNGQLDAMALALARGNGEIAKLLRSAESAVSARSERRGNSAAL